MVICDGCKANSSFEHHCCGKNAVANGELTGVSCDCQLCRFSKLEAAAANCAVSEEAVFDTFLSTEIRSEEDIDYICGFLEKLRPELANKIAVFFLV